MGVHYFLTIQRTVNYSELIIPLILCLPHTNKRLSGKYYSSFCDGAFCTSDNCRYNGS